MSVEVMGQVGPQTLVDGTTQAIRQGHQAEVVVQQLHGPYYEQTFRGNVFSASVQAAQAVTVALATTYTGLCLSNPPASGKNLVLLRVGLALSVAPAAIATLGLIGGYSISGGVTHTAALTPANNLLGAPKGVGLADSQATIPTPVWLHQLWSGFTAASLPSSSPADIDVAGLFVLPPGGFIAIGALTAVTGFWSMVWEEVQP